MHKHSAYAHEEPYLLKLQDSLYEGRHPASAYKLIIKQLVLQIVLRAKYKMQQQIAGNFKRQLPIGRSRTQFQLSCTNNKDSDTYSQLGEVVLDGPNQYYNHQRSQRCLMHQALMVPRNSRKHLVLHVILLTVLQTNKLRSNQFAYQFVHTSIEG